MAREEGRNGCDELWGTRKAQKERRMDLIVEERLTSTPVVGFDWARSGELEPKYRRGHSAV